MKPNLLHGLKFDEILHQHERLLVLMDRLHQSSKSATAREPLLAQLRELRGHLIDHFAYEEADQNLLNALAGSPQVQNRAATLLKQHQVLLQDLDALIAMTPTTEHEAATRRDYFAKLASFVSAFHEHEHQENRLLQDAANQNFEAVD